MTSLKLTTFAILGPALLVLSASPSQAIDYDALVAKAQSDLSGGMAQEALAESQNAIALRSDRWEAWLIAGGALQILGRYSEATTDYQHAASAAPEEKRASIENLVSKMNDAQASALLGAGLANLDQRTQAAGKALTQGMANAAVAGEKANEAAVLASLKSIASGFESAPSSAATAFSGPQPLAGVAGAGGMSAAQQQAEAQRLSNLCSSDPSYRRYLQQSQTGKMSASYYAAAALIQCYYNNVSPGYPASQKQQWLQDIQSNLAQARAYQ